MNPNLKDPTVPDYACYYGNSSDNQSTDCFAQWLLFEKQCMFDIEYKYPPSCDDVFTYTEGWSTTNILSSTVRDRSLTKKLTGTKQKQ